MIMPHQEIANKNDGSDGAWRWGGVGRGRGAAVGRVHVAQRGGANMSM